LKVLLTQIGEVINRKTSNIIEKKTTVYTHINGDRPSHIENSKTKLFYYTAAH